MFDAWLEETFELLTSIDQLAELRDVLARPRLQKRITPTEAEKLLDLIRTEAIVLQTLPTDVDLSPDPDDNTILAITIAGQADLIVSGDKGDMLSLGEAEGIPIVTARNAAEQLNTKN